MIVSLVLCITDGTQIRKVVVFLQSCKVSLPVLHRSSGENNITCIDGYDVISVKREPDSDTDCQGEETAVAISFTTIKSEQDEVSYIAVCPLLGALCRYTEIFTPIHHLHISVNLSI
jgi:hypothetical protein